MPFSTSLSMAVRPPGSRSRRGGVPRTCRRHCSAELFIVLPVGVEDRCDVIGTAVAHPPCTQVASFMKRLPSGFTNRKGRGTRTAWDASWSARGLPGKAPPATPPCCGPSPALPLVGAQAVNTRLATGANASMLVVLGDVARGQNDALGRALYCTYSPDLFWQMAPVTFPDSSCTSCTAGIVDELGAGLPGPRPRTCTRRSRKPRYCSSKMRPPDAKR